MMTTLQEYQQNLLLQNQMMWSRTVTSCWLAPVLPLLVHCITQKPYPYPIYGTEITPSYREGRKGHYIYPGFLETTDLISTRARRRRVLNLKKVMKYRLVFYVSISLRMCLFNLRQESWRESIAELSERAKYDNSAWGIANNIWNVIHALTLLLHSDPDVYSYLLSTSLVLSRLSLSNENCMYLLAENQIYRDGDSQGLVARD
jgi:hypothetical protein